MKEKIIIRSVLRSQNPKNAYQGIRVAFDFASNKTMSDSANFKGITENACWYNDLTLFDKLPIEIIGKPVDATFKSIQNSRNPMRSVSTIETVYYNGESISLL